MTDDKLREAGFRTAREISDAPDHPEADEIRHCDECDDWTPHRVDDGVRTCLDCEGDA